MEKETQAMIDSIIPDQYSAIGKLHRIAFTFGVLRRTATKAVDIFSNYNENEHQQFMFAVAESLDHIDTIAQAMDETRVILEWMRVRRAEIFYYEANEQE